MTCMQTCADRINLQITMISMLWMRYQQLSLACSFATFLILMNFHQLTHLLVRFRLFFHPALYLASCSAPAWNLDASGILTLLWERFLPNPATISCEFGIDVIGPLMVPGTTWEGGAGRQKSDILFAAPLGPNELPWKARSQQWTWRVHKWSEILRW